MFGIPQLLSGVSVKNSAVGLLGRLESELWGILGSAGDWGVFTTGTSDPAVLVDSVAELSLRADTAVANFKIETGGFVSYDKVMKPFEVPIRLTKGGAAADRKIFIDWLEEARQNTTLFDIVTPENAYTSMTLASYTINRASGSGANLIIADCNFQERRNVPQVYLNSQTGEYAITVSTENAAAPVDQPPSLLKRIMPQIPGLHCSIELEGC